MDTKTLLDWVAGVEENLASCGKPAENKDDIGHQVARHKDIRQEVRSQRPRVDEVVKKAREELESNNNNGGSKDKGTQQQYQRLKYSTNDLAVRMEGVSR